MRKVSSHALGSLCLTFLLVLIAGAQDRGAGTDKALTLDHRYELPASIKGHFDHFAVDPQGKRVFGTAVEDKRVIVFSLDKGLRNQEQFYTGPIYNACTSPMVEALFAFLTRQVIGSSKH